jgi:hypothetical protein
VQLADRRIDDCRLLIDGWSIEDWAGSASRDPALFVSNHPPNRQSTIRRSAIDNHQSVDRHSAICSLQLPASMA